jgi:hypothetical protein
VKIAVTPQVSIPASTSLAMTVAKDPALDLVTRDEGSAAPGSSVARTTPSGEAFVPATSGPAIAAIRDQVIGKRIAFANAGVSLLDKGLPQTGLALPAGTHTMFEVVGVVISAADTYHAFTRHDASRWDQALSVANTVSSLTDLLVPVVPVLQHYQPALQGVELVLKAVKTGNEALKSEHAYRVVQLKVDA